MMTATKAKLFWLFFADKGEATNTGVYANHPKVGRMFMGRTLDEARTVAAETTWCGTEYDPRQDRR